MPSGSTRVDDLESRLVRLEFGAVAKGVIGAARAGGVGAVFALGRKLDIIKVLGLAFGCLKLGAAAVGVIGAARIEALRCCHRAIGGSPTAEGRRSHPMSGFGRRAQIDIRPNWGKAGGLGANHC